jgi:aminomethyltransferase
MEGREIPRQGCPVLVAGDPLGAVTSGNFSPTLGRGIGMARVDAAAHLQPGTPVEVEIRGNMARGVLAKTPFVTRTG